MYTQEVINGTKKKKNSNYDKLVHQSAAQALQNTIQKEKSNLYQMGIS